MNEADPNASQDTRLNQESDAATRITHLSRQLTRGVEILFHELNGDNLNICLPKHIKEYTLHWVDTPIQKMWTMIILRALT